MHSTAWMNLTCHTKRNKADTKGRTVRGRTQTSLPRLARAAVGKGMPWLARPTGEGPAARSVPGQDSSLGRGCRLPLGSKRAPDIFHHLQASNWARVLGRGPLAFPEGKLGYLGQDTSRPSHDCLSREQPPVPLDTGSLNPTSGLQGRRPRSPLCG